MPNDDMTSSKGAGQPAQSIAPSYEGWTNSATYLVNLYQTQSPEICNKVCHLARGGDLNTHTLQSVARIDRTARSDERFGYIQGTIYLDDFAAGDINWSELVENWLSELRNQG